MTPKELNEIAKKLVAQLGDAHKATVDVVPPGWVTAVQMAKTLGIARRTAGVYLRKVGAEVKNFRVQLAKNIKTVPHYRLK